MKDLALAQSLTVRGKKLRIDTIALAKPNGGYHFGGSFSCIEILLSLFDYVLKENTNNKFVMSKGHACWPYYVLLKELGHEPLLEGHPHIGNGVNYTTGSMGHGMPATLGMAMARKIQGVDGQLYVLVGDGECQEGTTWESMLIAKRFNVGNLTVIVDMNGIQGSGYVDEILPINALGPAAAIIGWDVTEVNGHNIEEVTTSLSDLGGNNPKMIICHTIKGKGIPFMEDVPAWHAQWVDDEREEEIKKILK
jgi:transketolase